MKTHFGLCLGIVLLAGAITSCQDDERLACGSIEVLMDDIRYDVNACEDLNFRNGCDYTIDYLELCYEEGGQSHCQEVSIAFVTPLELGQHVIVHPDDAHELTPGRSYITGYFGELGGDESLVPINYMKSGRLSVTNVNAHTGTVSGTFEFLAKMIPESTQYIEVSGSFLEVVW